MPIYRYECPGCSEIFRVLQPSGSRTSEICPACGGEEAERLLPRIGVVYRGNGFYATDYRSKGAVAGRQ